MVSISTVKKTWYWWPSHSAIVKQTPWIWHHHIYRSDRLQPLPSYCGTGIIVQSAWLELALCSFTTLISTVQNALANQGVQLALFTRHSFCISVATFGCTCRYARLLNSNSWTLAITCIQVTSIHQLTPLHLFPTL